MRMTNDTVGQQLSLFGLKKSPRMYGHEAEIKIELNEITTPPKESIYYD